MFAEPAAAASSSSPRKGLDQNRSTSDASARLADLPESNLIIRARIVLPVSQKPIENGAIAIADHRIAAVGKWKDISSTHHAEVLDLGEMILLPGLINAHCHLDYTSMAGQLPPPRSFVDWLKLITTSKSGLIYSDFAESWLAGAKMLLHSGTTTVADVEMVPELLPDIWSATPLRVISFLEMTGVKSRRPAAEILGEAMEKIGSIPNGRLRMGLSPHAPYSTHPDLLRLTGETARRENLPIVTHVAESHQEVEMFANGCGPMFDWLRRSGRDMSDCGLGSPVQHLERAGLLCKNLLAIHVNHLAAGDAQLLAKRGASVVHCPRSHAYFKHHPFPFHELSEAGVNICLGTDSLASLHKTRKQVVELDMFEELRQFASNNSALALEHILEMATVNAARALGREGEMGELIPGALADAIAIPHTGKITDAIETVLAHRGSVAASMIGGKWAITPQT